MDAEALFPPEFPNQSQCLTYSDQVSNESLSSEWAHHAIVTKEIVVIAQKYHQMAVFLKTKPIPLFFQGRTSSLSAQLKRVLKLPFQRWTPKSHHVSQACWSQTKLHTVPLHPSSPSPTDPGPWGNSFLDNLNPFLLWTSLPTSLTIHPPPLLPKICFCNAFLACHLKFFSGSCLLLMWFHKRSSVIVHQRHPSPVVENRSVLAM